MYYTYLITKFPRGLKNHTDEKLNNYLCVPSMRPRASTYGMIRAGF
jgi:hypothetical protein